LKASLSLGDVNHEVDRSWYVDDDTIYLHCDHTNEAELAQALAKALDVQSEADFYENLLRCDGGLRRKQKLLSKGISDAEVERCLREYSGQPLEEESEEKPESQETEEEKPDTSHPPSARGDERPAAERPLSGPQGKRSEKTLQPSDTGRRPLRLKDRGTVEYVLGSPPVVGGGLGTGGGDAGTGGERRLLTDAEKAQLEAAGRAFAARELDRMGFSVEEKGESNPGFDLLGKKDGDELRVELKAHSGRATVVDLTLRQYQEYLGQQGYRWELWNIEHLSAEDGELVTITRYCDIPDEALDTRVFRVDLKKCNICPPSTPPKE
jgi:hypothetical protein